MPNNAVTLSSLTQNEKAINRILIRLEVVRNTGPGRWIAKCPAHPDKRPSLAIKQAEDGRILLHCFAGCNTRAILEAIGLDYSDLFPGFKKQSSRQKLRENAEKNLEKALKRIAENAIIEEIRLAEHLLWKYGGWEEIMNNAPNSEVLAWLAHRLTYLDYLWHELTTNGISSDILLWLRKEAIV
ncbi:MAG: hypothetical protein ACPLRZ_11315 [Thermovenabulum sp.]|uniref:hypothetical protein n=1 Tax=Thermovenabulum sp. TaxID=3100335 RepID=UPI003C7AEE87